MALGASDAVGVGADDPATQSWPAVLAGQLPPGSRFVNLGVPGITLTRALQVELPVALDALAPSSTAQSRPLATVWLAVNDLATGVSLATYSAALQLLLHELHTRTRATVLVGNLPDLALLPAAGAFDRQAVDEHVRAWNTAIATIARRNGARLIDLYSNWRDLARHPEYVSSDGFHPSTAGYRRLAALFWSAVPR